MRALPGKLLGGLRGSSLPTPSPQDETITAEDTSTPAGRWAFKLDAGFLLEEAAVSQQLEQIDAALNATAPADRPALFADVSEDIFALLCLHRPGRYPNIAAWLPTLPSEELQLNSTGAEGQQTMLSASRFVAATAARYSAMGRDLPAARLLDFGIYWARISRLFYKYVPTSQLYGVDAWPSSLEAARDCGYAGHLALIDELPSDLPFDGLKFDLVVAFSVFTHLSERSSEAALGAIRGRMAEGGLLALTLRPRAFAEIVPSERREALAEGADATGFGYFPEPWSEGGRYGDSIVTLEYVRRRWTAFELVGVEVNAEDPYQIYAFLRPR